MAEHVLARSLVWVSDSIHEKQPSLTDYQIQSLVEKERVFLLPGGTTDEKQAISAMQKMMLQKMDITKDQKLGQKEFIMQWIPFASSLYKGRESKAMNCVIL
eukprot:TRINITY_DN1976_c0_g2_i1.p1 TRINITY_DN1976_c0_g2~~TRINITY_DN1976_c0_g2_i1.p1  ORF type:complete len:102 (+),score=22.18 TRINITY_DN1976_c0_g2_i1:2-307(+)